MRLVRFSWDIPESPPVLPRNSVIWGRLLDFCFIRFKTHWDHFCLDSVCSFRADCFYTVSLIGLLYAVLRRLCLSLLRLQYSFTICGWDRCRLLQWPLCSGWKLEYRVLLGWRFSLFFCFCKAASGCCFHHSGKRNTGLKNMYHLLDAFLEKNQCLLWSLLCVHCRPSGFASGGSSLKLKADLERGKMMAFTRSSHYHTWISGVSLSRMYLHWHYLNFIK